MDSLVAACAFFLIVQQLPTGECTTWSCDFETSDLCGYTQDTTDDLDWTRNSGGSPTSSTGPSVDHTLGTSSGYYMYLETSVGSPGDVARLVSAPLPASSTPYCLRFYYHMFGDSVETLNVYIMKQGIMGTPVWTLSSNQGNVWTFAHAQLDGSNSFNVVFEAVRGNSFRGDMAIDDVTVSDECAPIATTVLPTTTPYPDASPSCTFELSSICGYRQDIHDSAEWTWHQGHTATDATGPGLDHTTGTVQGHYMYFEASDVSRVTARLLSPTLPIIPSSSNHTSYCLTFWYHMYGLHIGTLIVNRKEIGGSKVPLWSLSDEQGNAWRQGQLPLDGTAESTVVFEAVRGSSYRGDIAIDDVDVIQYRGQCEFIPASAMVHLPTTPTVTTQSPSTSASLSTTGTLSTVTSMETSSTIVTIATRPSSTTESILSAASATTTSVPPSSTITTQASSTSTYLSTSGTLPIVSPTETSSTSATIATRPSSTTGRPTTLQTSAPTSDVDVETTSARTSTTTSSEASSPATSATDSPSQDVTTDRTTQKSVKPMATSSTQPSHITGFGTTTGGNLSAGQTDNSATTIIIAVAVVLSLVCGAVAGVVATVCYKRKKRSRSGHAKVKYRTEENSPTSPGDSFPSGANGRVEFENPTFEHIYEELPNVVVNNTTLRQQGPLSAMSYSQPEEVYMEINDDKARGAKASSQQRVLTNKGDGHVSSPAKANALFPSPRQVDQRGRRYGGHRERNAAGGNTTDTEVYRRGGRETKNDSRPPTSHPNRPDMNRMRNTDEDYERIRSNHYQDLNPRPPDNYESLRPDHYQKLNVPEHAPNPDGYQSLRHNHYQHLGVPGHAQNQDWYQSLRHNHSDI